MKALRSYRKEWNDEKGCWKDDPRHDWASHGADALRYAAMAWHDRLKTLLDDVIPPAPDNRLAVLCPTDLKTQRGVTLDEIWEYNESSKPARQRV